jgi:hypothetical protein
LYTNPSIVAEPTFIDHVTSETTSPEAAVASLGCFGDGDALADDDRPADGVAPAEADADGVPVAPAVGVGAADEGAEGAEGSEGSEGSEAEADADALGLGLGLLGAGKQKMTRMQTCPGDPAVACGAADARPPVNPISPAASSATAASVARRFMTALPRPAVR